MVRAHAGMLANSTTYEQVMHFLYILRWCTTNPRRRVRLRLRAPSPRSTRGWPTRRCLGRYRGPVPLATPGERFVPHWVQWLAAAAAMR